MKRAMIALGAGIVLLLLSDHLIAKLANDKLLETDVDFHARLAKTELDMSGLRRRSKAICEINYIFLIYAYQTCFEPYISSESTNEWGYIYVYHRPRPKLTLFFRGDSSENYYFKELQLGRTIYFIGVDGTIRKTKGGY